ncbi:MULTISPECIES: DHA2 family efflux MFS transporter permease subunit [unclassified Streptomyces]|uniref:DHA2 family efflux MFS transporter permease subunit n=1 Tax=unclassified Streptomyces TaxID=2593676 RepID=UPI002E29D288|nr:DHA2 family efflux MFS transporter permease subunit [Streptomyces sp. NBC_00223]
MTASALATGPADTPGPPGPPAPPAPAVGRLRWLGLAVVLAVEVMDLLDTTIVGIASPSVQADFGGSSTRIQWITASYTLAFAVLMIAGARLGDIVGRRRMFLVGVAGFAVCSLLCACASSSGMLIATRAGQGVFAAMMVPQGIGLVRQIFPPDRIGSAFAFFGPVMGLAAVGGPVLGGWLTDADVLGTGWRAVFLINVPLAAAAFLTALRVLPESRAPHAPRLDLPGVGLVSAAVLLLVYPLVQGRDLGWPLWSYGLMAAALPVLGVFALRQRALRARGGSPLIEPGLFRHRGYTGSLAVGVVFFAALAGLMLVLTLFLQYGLGYSPLRAGLTTFPWALGSAIGATLSGTWLGPKYGRRTIQAGLVTTAVAIGAVALTVRLAGDAVTGWQLLPSLLVSGIGLGVVMAPFFDIALAGVSDEETGSASGVLNAVQQLGGSIGVAVLGTVFFSRAGQGAGEGGPGTRGAAHGVAHGMGGAAEATLLIAAAALAVSGAVAFLMPRRAAHAAPAGPSEGSSDGSSDTPLDAAGPAASVASEPAPAADR